MWWKLILCAIVGLAVAGPIGIIAGILIGAYAMQKGVKL